VTSVQEPPTLLSRKLKPVFRYAVVDEVDHDLLARVLFVDGFFTERQPEKQAWRTFRLFGCSPYGALAELLPRLTPATRHLANVEVRILDSRERPIGSYYVAAFEVNAARPSPLGPGLVDVRVSGVLLSQPHPRAEPIWDYFREGGPRIRGEWAGYSPEGREAWLEVVRRHSFRREAVPGAASSPYTVHRNTAKPEPAVFELDGERVEDRAGLYCALGEAVNGPGGYFGADLDSLRDCLRGGFGVQPPFDLRWKAADRARARLASAAEATVATAASEDKGTPHSPADDVVRVLREARVRVLFE
jgi:RNAse (barnase) inhibitor barstar